MSQLIYPRAGLLHKKPFSAEWVAPALRLSHASSHAAEDCRTAECLRCGEANVVDQIKSLSLCNTGEQPRGQVLEQESLTSEQMHSLMRAADCLHAV